MSRATTLSAAVATAAMLLLPAAPLHAANILVFPQFVTGGGYTSSLTLVNTNQNSTVRGTLALFNQDGTPRPVNIEGRGTASTFDVTLDPGATAVLNTTLVAGGLVVGMAKFTSDLPAGGVARFEFAGGQVGVLNAPMISNGTLVLNTNGGNDTGVAICNPGSTPINIELANVDQDGATLERIDPPELNPLPANGQIAKFVTQFAAFRQVANRNSGSIQIRVKGEGQFSAFAILALNGRLSSTALVKGASGKSSLFEIGRGYAGTWRATSFNGGGNLNMAASLNTSTQIVLINISLVPTRDLWGNSANQALPITLFGPFRVGGFRATGSNAYFGQVTLDIDADGNWTFSAPAVPDEFVASFTMTGVARPDTIAGKWVTRFKPGLDPATFEGTLTMNYSGN